MSIRTFQPCHLMPAEDVGGYGYGNGGDGSNGGFLVMAPSLVGENRPTQQFDLSVLAGMSRSQKYLGRNTVGDIQDAYATYTTGSIVGRGGQYAADAARRYGTTLTEAARGYLVSAGLPTLADVLPDTNGNGGGNGGGGNGGGNGGGGNNGDIDALRKQFEESEKNIKDTFNKQIDDLKKQLRDAAENTPLKQLIDVLPSVFGGATSSAPLESQAYGYTSGSVDSGGGNGIGMILLLGGIAVAAYVAYKYFKG